MTNAALSTQMEAKKLSRVRRGHWRNLFSSTLPVRFISGALRGPGEWLGFNKWPSREIAEEKANRWMTTQPGGQVSTYVGPVFFPADDDLAGRREP